MYQDITPEIHNQVTELFLKTKDCYLVIARKLRLNSHTVKSLGLKILGNQMFYARENSAKNHLVEEIKTIATNNIAYTAAEIASRVGISTTSLFKVLQNAGHNLSSVREQAEHQDEDPSNFSFIEVKNEEPATPRNIDHKDSAPSLPYQPREYQSHSYHQGYQRYNNYHRNYQPRYHQGYHDNYQRDYSRTSPTQVKFRSKIAGMEFTFDSSDEKAKELIIEILQRVQGRE